MQTINKNINITDYISNEINFDNAERIDTGFSNLDVSVNGFRRGGTYLVAGVEKSGKSSFLTQCMLHFLAKGKKVVVIDTELDSLQFYSRLLAVENNTTVTEAEENIEGLKAIQKKYFNNLIRFDNQNLSKEGTFDFDLAIKLTEKAVKELECEVLIFDNLTTYQSQNADSKNMVLPACISKVITLTKNLSVWSFVVTHIKPDVKISDLPSRVADYIKSEEPEKIFTDSITLVRKPTSADIYGGQQALSQLSGTLIVWRPYQFLRSSEKLKGFCQLLVMSFRDGARDDVYFDFLENKIKFIETSVNQMSVAKVNNSYKD